MEMNDSLTVM